MTNPAGSYSTATPAPSRRRGTDDGEAHFADAWVPEFAEARHETLPAAFDAAESGE